MQIILLPGLGDDYRCFRKQTEYFPEALVPPWIPVKPGESLESYAQRMGDSLEVGSDCVVVGLSFGGAVAPYLARQIHARGCVIISMTETPEEFPKRYYPFYLWIRCFPRLFYVFFMLLRWTLWLFLPIFRLFIRRFYCSLISVAIQQDAYSLYHFIRMLLWWAYRREEISSFQNRIHIHGEKDKIVPYVCCKHVDFPVPAAGHVLNITHSEAVNAIIEQFISALPEEKELE